MSTSTAGQEPTTTTPATGQEPAAATPAGQAPAAAPGQEPTGTPPADTIDSLPEWARKEIESLRKENAKRRKDADAEKVKAEEERLAAERKWQELAEKRGQEVEALKATAEKYTALAEAQKTRIMAEVEKWPAELKALMPQGDADVAALAEWADKARPIVAQLTRDATAAPGQGQPPKPAGVGTKAAADVQAAALQQVRNRF